MTTDLRFNIGGQEIRIPLTEEQTAALLEAIKTDRVKNGWEKPEMGEDYFYEDALGRVQKGVFETSGETMVDLLHEKANCYSSEYIANQIARGDTLIRNLRRFSIENRKNPIDRITGGYTITYNYLDRCLEIGMTGNWMALGDIVFDTEETAKKAKNLYADELTWYFTEMKDAI